MTMVPSRSSKLGPAARPVAVPIDFDVSSDVKAEGVVELPIHVWWSEPRRTFDLVSERDRRRLYELVLTEGDEADVRFYVRFETLKAVSYTHLDVYKRQRLQLAPLRPWCY